jgi:glycosyltransferase involved in cell wall biosynthesis
MASDVRVLGIQIANGFSPEARVFAELLACTERREVEAHVLFHRSPGDTETVQRFEAASRARVLPMDFGWRSVAAGRSLRERVTGRMRFLASLPRAVALARRVDPDVIYSCQQLWDCQAATYIARRLRKPQVVHLHYTVGPWLHAPILSRLQSCNHVIAISDFIREEAKRCGVPAHRLTTIRNTITVPSAVPGQGAELRQELGISPTAPLVGIVARLDPEKGQADTLAAFALVLVRYPEARLLIVGDETPWHPGFAAGLRKLAAELRIEHAAHFLGRRSDVPQILSALDVFVHPSRREPCGLAVLEASAAGVPVVAYAEGGPREIVEHGVTGLMAAPGDVTDLAEQLGALLGDPHRAREMGASGRARMRREFRPAEAGVQFARVLGTFGARSSRDAMRQQGVPLEV